MKLDGTAFGCNRLGTKSFCDKTFWSKVSVGDESVLDETHLPNWMKLYLTDPFSSVSLPFTCRSPKVLPSSLLAKVGSAKVGFGHSKVAPFSVTQKGSNWHPTSSQWTHDSAHLSMRRRYERCSQTVFYALSHSHLPRRDESKQRCATCRSSTLSRSGPVMSAKAAPALHHQRGPLISPKSR